MTRYLFLGVGDLYIGLTIARVCLGTFFLLSGYHKLFNAERHATEVETLKSCRVPFVGVMQWFVPSVEFSAGAAIAIGILAPLAALGLIFICIVATCTDGLRRVRSWKPIDRGDFIDDVLYLPEVLYLILLIVFLVDGAGPWSVDAVIAHSMNLI